MRIATSWSSIDSHQDHAVRYAHCTYMRNSTYIMERYTSIWMNQIGRGEDYNGKLIQTSQHHYRRVSCRHECFEICRMLYVKHGRKISRRIIYSYASCGWCNFWYGKSLGYRRFNLSTFHGHVNYNCLSLSNAHFDLRVFNMLIYTILRNESLVISFDNGNFWSFTIIENYLTIIIYKYFVSLVFALDYVIYSILLVCFHFWLICFKWKKHIK